MDFGINDANDELITPTPPSSNGGWEAVGLPLPEIHARPEDSESERQIDHNLESISVEECCKRLKERCAKMQAQLEDSPQGEVEEGPLAEQELIPLWAGLGGWIDPLARTIMVFIASIVIFVAGLSTIVLAASLFYLGAGVIKGRFTTTPAAMDAPPFQIQPEVRATNALLGSLPEMINLTEVSRKHGSHPCTFLHLVELVNINTTSLRASAPAQAEQQIVSSQGWYELYSRYIPSGEYIGILIIFLIVVGPKIANAMGKWYSRKTEELLRPEEECLNHSSSQALGGFQDSNLFTRKRGTKEKSREYIALISELDFNKAKTHKMLGCLEKWDKVKFIRVNEPRGLLVVAFASKSVWLCATQPEEGRASRQPIRFNGETIRMIPLD